MKDMSQPTHAGTFEGDSSGAAVAPVVREDIGIEGAIKEKEEHGVFPKMEPIEALVRAENELPASEAIDSPQQEATTNYADSHAASRNSRNRSLVRKIFTARDEGKESSTDKKKNKAHGKGHQGSNKRRRDRQI